MKRDLWGSRVRESICQFCRQPVIWARTQPEKVRSGGRALVPFPVDEVPVGTGNIALSKGMFDRLGEAPIAMVVTNGTSYRSHRDHCPAIPKPSRHDGAAAAPLRSFTGAARAKKSRGGK